MKRNFVSEAQEMAERGVCAEQIQLERQRDAIVQLCHDRVKINVQKMFTRYEHRLNGMEAKIDTLARAMKKQKAKSTLQKLQAWFKNRLT